MEVFVVVIALANVFCLSAFSLSILTEGFRTFLLQEKLAVFELIFLTLCVDIIGIAFLPIEMCVASFFLLIIFLIILLSKKFWVLIRKSTLLTIVISIFIMIMQLVSLHLFLDAFTSLLKML